jgi:hypothetical protein
VQTLETDIPQYANLNVGTNRNSLDDYFSYMERAGLIGRLRNETSGIRGLRKVDKVYLDNTNIIFNLVGDK